MNHAVTCQRGRLQVCISVFDLEIGFSADSEYGMIAILKPTPFVVPSFILIAVQSTSQQYSLGVSQAPLRNCVYIFFSEYDYHHDTILRRLPLSAVLSELISWSQR